MLIIRPEPYRKGDAYEYIEEFMVILTAGILLVAILDYIRKHKK